MKILKNHNAYKIILISVLSGFNSYISAAPIGSDIVYGSGSISSVTNGTVIDQQSSYTAINWSDYSISADEVVNYYQPSADSISLSRITGNDPVAIYGEINSDGTLFLVAPMGLYLAPTAQLNADRLIISTLDINLSDFAAGIYNFNQTQNPNPLVLDGIINAREVWLIGGDDIQLNGLIDTSSNGSLNILSGPTQQINLSSVPVPSAVWLFVSGLIGLIGVTRRRQ